MTRVQGGTNGLLSAIDAEVVDPLNANTPIDRPRQTKGSIADERQRTRARKRLERKRAKQKALAERSPF